MAALTLAQLMQGYRYPDRANKLPGGITFGELQAYSGLTPLPLGTAGWFKQTLSQWQGAYDALYALKNPSAPSLPSLAESQTAASRRQALEDMAKRGRLSTILTGDGLTGPEKKNRLSSLLGSMPVLGA